MNQNGNLELKQLERMRQQVENDPVWKMAMNAVTRGNLQEVGLNRDVLNNLNFVFSHEIENKAGITDQKASGTCWMYADLNYIRILAQRKNNMEAMDFSHNYVMFWDKLEKANSWLNIIIELRDKPLDDRKLFDILSDGASDGGEWHILRNVIKKYGLLPQSAMPDTFNKENSRFLNATLAYKLREMAHELRKMNESGKSVDQLHRKRSRFMEEIFRILVVFFGMPPEKFDWGYRDKDKKYHQEIQITPMEFYQKYVELDMDTVYCLGHCPGEKTPFYKTYTLEFFNNVTGGIQWKWLNLPMNEIKKYAVKILKKDEPVIFGCDVLQNCFSKAGILYEDVFDFEMVFQTTFKMDRETRMNYGQSFFTHCMLLTGVDLIKGKPQKWKVENSWGSEVGKKGYFLMSDKWFESHTCDLLVPQKYLSEKHLDLFKQEPVVLPPWHPI